MDQKNERPKGRLTFENLKIVLICSLGAMIWGKIFVGLAQVYFG
ncbi:hypothetical protein ACP2AV_07360 [Aliiroseovarius sp. PTFE2010]|tara:strand:- start:1341 stop:1472 length:132 start_codon:yes stop_codon:yes gene_type:complete